MNTPTESGWYWYKFSKNDVWEVAYVHITKGKKFVRRNYLNPEDEQWGDRIYSPDEQAAMVPPIPKDVLEAPPILLTDYNPESCMNPPEGLR